MEDELPTVTILSSYQIILRVRACNYFYQSFRLNLVKQPAGSIKCCVGLRLYIIALVKDLRRRSVLALHSLC